MKNIIILSLSALILGGCASFPSNDPADAYAYKKELTALRTHLTKKNIDKQWVKEESLGLIERARPLLESFAAKYPDCGELIAEVLNNQEKMLQMELPEIERQFHEGEALPESDLRCYNPKELVVHPATVYVLTQTDDVEKPEMSMRAELEELDLHFELFREDLLRE